MHVSTLILLVATVSASAHVPHAGSFTSLLRNDELAVSLKEAEAILAPSLLEIPSKRGQQEPTNIPLNEVFFHVNDETTIELTNLRLSKVQLGEFNNVSPDLTFLNLQLALSFGSLVVEGDFNVVSKNKLEVPTGESSGTISMEVTDVSAQGQVGLTLGEKSLQATNFDMTYTPKKVIITVTYETNEGSAVSHEAQDDSLFLKVRDNVWYQLNLILKKELNNRLEVAPVTRLLPNENTLLQFRGHARAITAVANTYIDEVLTLARKRITDSKLEQIAIPELVSGFSKTILWVEWHGTFTANQGWGRNLASIKRTSDISLSYDESTLSVFGSLGLGELKVGFDAYHAEFMDIGPKGNLKAEVGYNSVFIKASVTIGTDASASLENLRVDNIDDIELTVTGLGILDWLTSKIATWVLGFFNDPIKQIVNEKLSSYVGEVLALVNPNDYFM